MNSRQRRKARRAGSVAVGDRVTKRRDKKRNAIQVGREYRWHGLLVMALQKRSPGPRSWVSHWKCEDLEGNLYEIPASQLVPA